MNWSNFFFYVEHRSYALIICILNTKRTFFSYTKLYLDTILQPNKKKITSLVRISYLFPFTKYIKKLRLTMFSRLKSSFLLVSIIIRKLSLSGNHWLLIFPDKIFSFRSIGLLIQKTYWLPINVESIHWQFPFKKFSWSRISLWFQQIIHF